MTQLEKIAQICENTNLHFHLCYGSIINYALSIWQKSEVGIIKIFDGQGTDLSLLLSRGEVALKGWCDTNRGGYYGI